MSPDHVAPTFSASDLRSRLRDNGLEWLGTFAPGPDEGPFPDRAIPPRMIAIVGNVGSRIWPIFASARQKRPDLTLDRWTEETIGRIAEDFGVEAVYPFEGPPFHPFIQWARRTGTLFSSPIGLTIHPSYGLWVAFRAALLIDAPLDRDHADQIKPVPARRPCDDCEDRPCLRTCPVGAFTADGYDFRTCLDQVAKPVNACRGGGCLARIACPVGKEHRYDPAHAAFHMGELLKAHGKG
ncbi:MAG: ferredoxin [Geminicoccaceae bacterium]